MPPKYSRVFLTIAHKDSILLVVFVPYLNPTEDLQLYNHRMREINGYMLPIHQSI